jgi:hypothetical protein
MRISVAANTPVRGMTGPALLRKGGIRPDAQPKRREKVHPTLTIEPDDDWINPINS